MTHIEKAKALVEQTNTTSPGYANSLLRGILHALLALHEQNEPKPTRTRTTTPKAADK